LTFICLEIQKFKKDLSELASDYDRWLFAFKNLHRLKDHPKELEAGIFKRLIEIAELATFDEAEQLDYRESLKAYWDLKSALSTSYEEGKAEGKRERDREIVRNSPEAGA
jgi:hypothetical protein